MSDDWRVRRADQIRAMILAADPEITEEIAWRKPSNPGGVPTFSRSGLVCTLETYRDKLKLTFARGAAIDDPTGIFNASLDAGTRRAIDVREDDALDEAAFAALVLAAVAANER